MSPKKLKSSNAELSTSLQNSITILLNMVKTKKTPHKPKKQLAVESVFYCI